MKKDRNGTKLRTFAHICICSNFKKLRTDEPHPVFTGSYKKSVGDFSGYTGPI